MSILKKSLLSGLLVATTALVAVPAAQAQVAGIGTADELAVIMSSNAFRNGFQQINTQFGANLTTIDTRANEVQQLQQQLATQFDANKDQQLSPEEQQKMQASNSPLIGQIQAKQQEMETLEAPIRAAQIFVVDTLDKNYQQALKDTVAAKKVNVVLSPDAVQWAPPAISLNEALKTRLDQLTPTVNITAPDPFNTSRRVLAIYEQIQQVQQARLMNAIRQQQAQQAQQQGQPGAPAPAAPAPGTTPAPKPQQPDDGR
jgi:Skp family chaperone for outer membrane proteins